MTQRKGIEVTAKSTPDAIVEFRQVDRVFVRRERATGLGASVRAFFRPTYREKRAVEQLTFHVTRGRCVGLVGANGAGKTTLLKMAAGLLHPTAGDVRVLGFRPADRKPDYLSRIGMVMGQKSQLWIDIPAGETFELLAAIYGVPDAVAKARVQELARILDVEKLLGVQVRRLSLGERMKCEIIAALLHEPELLFLDEPTIGLDVVAKHAIREFVRRVNRERGATVILSSHDMSDIVEVCDELLFIHEGKLLFSGTIAAFHARFGPGSTAAELETLVRQIMTGAHAGVAPEPA